MTLRLSVNEARALLMVVNEREAGGTGDLGDALGLDYEEADRIMTRLVRVQTRLQRALTGRPVVSSDRREEGES